VVAAMALLHGARVLAAVDREGAKLLYAEGCAALEGLALTGHARGLVPWEAVRLGATVDPIAALALFRRLPAGGPDFHSGSTGRLLVQSLAQTGEFETAVELLEDLNCPSGGAGIVVHLAPDIALQRRAMSSARKRWRMARQPGPGFVAEREFFQVFSQHWQKLEPAEQRSWLDEILRTIETQPDRPADAEFGEVRLHSMHDRQLFDILNVLRALKPADQVEAILRAHRDVAKGAEIYPLGMESVMAQARAAAGNKACGTGGGFMVGGRAGDPLMEAAIKALRGDPSAVADMMAEALRLFREDRDLENPNYAPCPFWPSCQAYRMAMYWAGKTSGMDAAPLLDEIPDTDLALFASIELAAGVLGLPQYSGVQVGPRRPQQDFSP